MNIAKIARLMFAFMVMGTCGGEYAKGCRQKGGGQLECWFVTQRMGFISTGPPTPSLPPPLVNLADIRPSVWDLPFAEVELRKDTSTHAARNHASQRRLQ